MKTTEYSKILTSDNLVIIEMEIMANAVFLYAQKVGEEKYTSFFFDVITEELIEEIED